MKWFGFAALMACISSLPALADSQLLDELARRNSDINALSGTFTQAKTIAVLPMPLNSHGEFAVARDKVRWETLAPVRSSLEIRGGAINFADAEGKSLLDGSEGAANAKAASEIVARIFSGVVAGDLSALNEYFSASATGSLEQWQITLVPRSANMAAYIRQIQVQGREFTEQLEIAEANGDGTRILLTTSQVERAAP